MMKRLHRLFSFFFVLTLFSVFTSGCQKKEPECPFTTITWENTLEDITSLEGGKGETYDSVYGGMTYTYPKKYKEWDGTIKYMFNEEDKLVSLSWMYEAKDSEDLTDVYEQIHGEAEDMLGKSGFKFNTEQFADLASPGDVWYLETGNIILNTVDASDAKLLQYTFLHPDVSEENPRNEQSKNDLLPVIFRAADHFSFLLYTSNIGEQYLRIRRMSPMIRSSAASFLCGFHYFLPFLLFIYCLFYHAII